MTNILYRLAFRYNLKVMTFYHETPQAIHKMKLLRKKPRPRFDLIMEHLKFDETFFDEVMKGKKHYISTLRNPFDQLASQVHFLDTRGFSHSASKVNTSDQLEQILRSSENLNRYGQTYIKIPEKYTSSENDLNEYLESLSEKFLLILMTEYYDASLVLLKRKLSWTLNDIVYSPLKRGKYSIDTDTKEIYTLKHRKLRPVEYALFEYFNNTFWSSLLQESSDFWSEVKHYQHINSNISSFCAKYYEVVKGDIKNVRSVIKDKSKMTIEKSEWNDGFVVDAVDCILMKIHKTVFLITNTIKNFPILCKWRKHSSRRNDIRVISINKNYATFNSKYCSSATTKYGIPIDVLSTKGAYDWDDFFEKQK